MKAEGRGNELFTTQYPTPDPRHSASVTFFSVARYAGMDSIQSGGDAANDAKYGVEVLCAGWNPLVAVGAGPVEAARGLVVELANVDVQAFLARFYQFQQG
jgi:hypothetical protein